jgi:hypothetical protein
LRGGGGARGECGYCVDDMGGRWAERLNDEESTLVTEVIDLEIKGDA